MDHHAGNHRACKRPRVQVAQGASAGNSSCPPTTRTARCGKAGSESVCAGPALGEWRSVVLADAELSEQDAVVRQVADNVANCCAETGQTFVDMEFPPCVSSVDGRPLNKLRDGRNCLVDHADLEEDGGAGGSAPPRRVVSCKCGKPAKICTVGKANQNQGREFWGCMEREASKRCSFFKWADHDAPRAKQDLQLLWQRMANASPQAFTVVGPKGFRPEHILQGSVGDCWFLAALAVVAERGDELLSRNVLTRTPNRHGHYQFRLFIDGQWKVLSVDDHLPVRSPETRLPNAKKRDLPGMPALAYSKAADYQLWVPLLEKAYAKAHGCYKAISGGWIAEGLWDLTGFPTESIWFGARHFDSEATWARLLSFRDQGFLLGVICPASGEGLVGSHAYSVLDVRELTGHAVGEQKRIGDFFSAFENARNGAPAVSRTSRELPAGVTTEGTLRLVKIRNPWGQKEWTGAFSASSEQWTPKLRSMLGQSDKDNGTFWMSWHDVLSRFVALDVCKTHKGWYAASVENLRFLPSSWMPSQCVQIRINEPTWMYATICQPTKRGKARRRYYYSDISMLVVRTSSAVDLNNSSTGPEVLSVESLRLSGECRLSHSEMLLDDPTSVYMLIPISLGRAASIRSHALPSQGGPLQKQRGHVAKFRDSAPFSIRLQCAKPVQFRLAPASEPTLLLALHKALADVHLPHLHTSVVQLDDHAQLVIREGAGAAVAVVVNRSKVHPLRVQLLLHGAAEGACGSSQWHFVPANSQVVVDAIKALDNDDYETIGMQTSFALDQFQVERPLANGMFPSGEAPIECLQKCTLFSPVQVSFSQALVQSAAPMQQSEINYPSSQELEDALLQQAVERSMLDNAYIDEDMPNSRKQLEEAIALSLAHTSRKIPSPDLEAQQTIVVDQTTNIEGPFETIDLTHDVLLSNSRSQRSFLASNAHTIEGERPAGTIGTSICNEPEVIPIDHSDSDMEDIETPAATPLGTVSAAELPPCSSRALENLPHDVDRGMKVQIGETRDASGFCTLDITGGLAKSSSNPNADPSRVDSMLMVGIGADCWPLRSSQRPTSSSTSKTCQAPQWSGSTIGNHKSDVSTRRDYLSGTGALTMLEDSKNEASSSKIRYSNQLLHDDSGKHKHLGAAVTMIDSDLELAQKLQEEEDAAADAHRAKWGGLHKARMACICPVCMENLAGGEGVRLGGCPANHGICRGCLSMYVKTETDNGKVDIRCLVPDCDTQVTHREMRELLGEDSFAAVDQRAAEHAVNQDPNLHLCPTEKCGFITEWAGSQDGVPRLLCPRCSKECCVLCGAQPYHQGVTCDEHRQQQRDAAIEVGDQKALSRLDEEAETARFLRGANVRTCARCGALVMKSEGCDKMMCRCGYGFCFLCGSAGAKCNCTPSSHTFWDNSRETSRVSQRMNGGTKFDRPYAGTFQRRLGGQREPQARIKGVLDFWFGRKQRVCGASEFGEAVSAGATSASGSDDDATTPGSNHGISLDR